MSIEQQLYETILLLAGSLNVVLAIMLVYNNYEFRDFLVYRRARIFTALSFAAFGIGFIMHYFLHWRTSWPIGASALSVAYFHIGGVLFCWSHTSLLNYQYITRRIICRDVGILVLNLLGTLLALKYNVPFYTLSTSFLLFFAHAAFLATTLYRTYYSARENLMELRANADGYTIENANKKFNFSCHLIVSFGIGSVLFTLVFGQRMWPFSLLLIAGACVFSYIFYSLSEYAAIVKMASKTMVKTHVKSRLHPVVNIAICLLFCAAYPFSLHSGSEQGEATPATVVVNDSHEATTFDELKLQNEREMMEHKHSQMQLLLLIAAMLVVYLSLYIIISRSTSRRLRTANSLLEESNAQLKVASAKAEESSKMKSNFIKQISHEIRTPLNILSGFTQIVTTPDMTLSDEERAEINKGIIENTQRITDLVNKMLELSDANSQSVIERTDTVSPVIIASGAADKSGITAASHLTFTVQASEEAKAVMMQTNLHAAARALSLLLDNARKFTKDGQTVTLRIDTTTAQQDQKTAQTVQFIVEDTGIGIPATEAEHIFEEFVQLDDYYEGTGIGLTVARNLARRLGGDIILDTTYTAGARFVFSLPA